MRDPIAGDKVTVLKGVLAGCPAIVSYVNKEKHTITVQVPTRYIKAEDRHRLIANMKGYVPIVLLQDEDEYEHRDSSRFLIGEQKDDQRE